MMKSLRRTLASGRLLVLGASVGLFMACLSTRDAPAHDELRAVLAVLEHIEAMEFRFQRSDTLRLRLRRDVERAPSPASADLMERLESRGFSLVAEGEDLEVSELHVGIGAPVRIATDSFRIYTELVYVWSCPTGDFEAILFHVACEDEDCRVAHQVHLEQGEISVSSEKCPSSRTR